jgi:hypothetical protein
VKWKPGRTGLRPRIEELEARLAPAAEPVVVEIVYVSADGAEEVESRVEVPKLTGPA